MFITIWLRTWLFNVQKNFHDFWNWYLEPVESFFSFIFFSFFLTQFYRWYVYLKSVKMEIFCYAHCNSFASINLGISKFLIKNTGKLELWWKFTFLIWLIRHIPAARGEFHIPKLSPQNHAKRVRAIRLSSKHAFDSLFHPICDEDKKILTGIRLNENEIFVDRLLSISLPPKHRVWRMEKL